jgi:hypothetical protein
MSESKPEETNEERIARLKGLLEEDEAKEQATEKIFSPLLIAASTQEIQEIRDERIGRVRFKVLTWPEVLEIQGQIKGMPNYDQNCFYLWRMLSKADPAVTLEMVKALPAHYYNQLLELLFPLIGFFPAKSGETR